MRRLIVILSLFSLAAAAGAVEGDSLWSHTYGGRGNDYALSIIPSGDGGYLFLGITNSFGPNMEDIFLIKINAQGDTLWTRTYGGTADDHASTIIPAGDGGFLLAGWIGLNPDRIKLVKINSQGDTLWTHIYGDGIYDEYHAYSITPAGDGGFLLAGLIDYWGVGDWDDIYLLKVNSEGNTMWTNTYGGEPADWATCIISSGDGNFLIAGETASFGAGNLDIYLIKINRWGVILWTQTYGGVNNDEVYSILPAGDGGFLLAGGTNSFGAGLYDMYLLKINSQGDTIWTHTYGGAGYDEAYSIIPAEDGGFLLTGYTLSFGSGNRDIWLVKVNAQGDSQWSNTYGGYDWDEAFNAIQLGDGNFLVAGATASFAAGYEDMWLVCVEGSSTGVEPKPEILPSTFILYPSVPNPFNPSTTVRYELPAANLVSLKVYDTAGRLVQTLADGWREVGEHQAVFDGSGLPSGIYLAKLQAGELETVQKLVLMK